MAKASRGTPTGFVALASLRAHQSSPDQVLAEIRRIYFKTTRKTIEHDLAHAIELLKSLPGDEERDRAAVYMDGLSQMRSEWALKSAPEARPAGSARRPRPPRRR